MCQDFSEDAQQAFGELPDEQTQNGNSNNYGSYKEPKSDFNKRSSAYTRIITSYGEDLSEKLEQNRRQKEQVFQICILILALVFILWAIVLLACMFNPLKYSIQSIIALLTATVIPFLTSFIVLPEIITKYLFNHEEESALVKILISLLEYDKAPENPHKTKANPQSGSSNSNEDASQQVHDTNEA